MKAASVASEIVDCLLGGAAFSPPATLHFALYTVAPTEFGGGTECSGGSYARVAVANDLTTWDSAVDGTKTLAIPVTFPTATAPWGTVVAWGLHTAASGNVLYMYGPIDTPVAISASDTPTFAAGSIVIEEE